MFQTLVSHNDDLRRLVAKGYAVEIDRNHLLVRDIPYLDSENQLRIGTIVAKLAFIDQERVTQYEPPSIVRWVYAVRIGRESDPQFRWRGYQASVE